MSLRRFTGIFGVTAGLLLWTSLAGAASNTIPLPTRMGPRTNLTPPFPRPMLRPGAIGRTNVAPAITNLLRPTPAAAAAPRTNAPALSRGTNVAAAKGATTNAPGAAGSLWQRAQALRASPWFLPVIIGVLVCLAVLLLVRAFTGGKKAEAPGLQPLRTSAAKAGGRRTGIHSCNVLELGEDSRQVWQFDTRGGKYILSREHTCLDGEGLPRKLVSKDWRILFQPKLNIAWLPPENVFLRVIHLPRSNFDETLSMVELQLEKLSPIPVGQVVWSIQVLSHTDPNLQTVVVTIVARNVVEEFLGRLEGQGYLADRLELPLLDQLQTTAVNQDGAWVYPETGAARNTALVAWWYGGVLQNLDLLNLPAANRAASLKEQLLQMAWAGEMEGWISSAPTWHLVAAPAEAGEWEPSLREGLEQPIESVAPLPSRDLAALTARRAAQADQRANLLPAEYASRYHQQFVDRLWMRVVLAVGVLYLAFVAYYMARLGYASYRTRGVETEVAALGPTYTNAIQLRDRYKVLKDRQELKFAALDCWNVTAKNLPEDVTLESMNFSQGKTLTLVGTAPAGEYQKIVDFDREMRRAKVNDQPLFDPNKGTTPTWREQGSVGNWTLSLELKRSDVQ